MSWEKTDDEHYSLIIKKGSYITIEAARETLSEKALTSVYPFIYSSISNINIPEYATENKAQEGLGSVFGNTTGWLSAEEYSKTFFRMVECISSDEPVQKSMSIMLEKQSTLTIALLPLKMIQGIK